MSFIFGLSIGLVIAIITIWSPLAGKGTLRIDHSDPAKDKYRFEIDNLDALDRKRKVVLKIDHHANLSQK